MATLYECRDRLLRTIHCGKARLPKTLQCFVAAHGKFYEPDALPQGVRQELGSDPFKLCRMLTFNQHTAAYVYGFAYDGNTDQIVEHAWCLDKDGITIDPVLPSARLYFGVRFDAMVGWPEEVMLYARTWCRFGNRHRLQVPATPPNPVALERVVASLQDTHFLSPVRVVPNGCNRYVAMVDGTLAKDAELCIKSAGFDVLDVWWDECEDWAVEVKSARPDAFPALLQAMWQCWEECVAGMHCEYVGIQPTIGLRRTVSERLVCRWWPTVFA